MSDDIIEFPKKEKNSSNVISFPSSKNKENIIDISSEKEKYINERIKRQNMGMTHTFIHVGNWASFIGRIPDLEGNQTLAIATGPTHVNWENMTK